jgi:hypothetical protein
MRKMGKELAVRISAAIILVNEVVSRHGSRLSQCLGGGASVVFWWANP